MVDVIVVGAGNAGLCAALAASEAGAGVLVLEKAPRELRGGNTYFSGAAFRFPYRGLEDVRPLIPDLTESELRSVDISSYPQQEFREDLIRVSGGMAEAELVDTLVENAHTTMRWLRDKGVRWVLMYGRQSFLVDGVRRFWGGLIVEAVGGGDGLSNQLFAAAEAVGVEVRYGARAMRLLRDETGRISGVEIADGRTSEEVSARAVVLACGGFEANAEMRARHLGKQWAAAKVRGTEFNTGDGIRMALDLGAGAHGDWAGCHAVAWDLNAPEYGNRRIADLYQKHSYPYGITVNAKGKRFVDEGADFRNYTYAKYGREILGQPHSAAFQLFDAKVEGLLRDEYRIAQTTKAQAKTVRELADTLGIACEGLQKTVREFNASVQAGAFDPTRLDGKRTQGIEPPKSNWALPLDTPPYLGYAVTCGITFTYGGLRIDRKAQVLDDRGEQIVGLYAAGELVGGLFHHNYAGGTGLMAGAVFGRVAGASAAADHNPARGKAPS